MPAENRAIASALATASEAGGPALRVAEDDDATPSDDRSDLVDLYGTYHPFFVRGDLDGDGRLDFAQAFVETGSRGLVPRRRLLRKGGRRLRASGLGGALRLPRGRRPFARADDPDDRPRPLAR